MLPQHAQGDPRFRADTRSTEPQFYCGPAPVLVGFTSSMSHLGPVAIVGAGISGLSCAEALHLAGVEVTLFERASRVGGRCATRLWQGHLVDHGVQYFTASSSAFKRELLTKLRQFRPIIAPILDAERRIVHSSSGPRFYVLQGNNYLPQVIARDLNVHLDSLIETVTVKGDGIECQGKKYRAVISSLPSPQTGRLFGLEQATTPYACCLSALFEYSQVEIEDARECYARLLPETSGPLIASYCENHKVGRIIGDKTVFVVHAGRGFSATFADAPPEDYLPQLAEAQEELWRIPRGKCSASWAHRWRLCQASARERQLLELPPGAFVCGDSRSDSTVEDVWLDGRRAAEEVLAYLSA